MCFPFLMIQISGFKDGERSLFCMSRQLASSQKKSSMFMRDVIMKFGNYFVLLLTRPKAHFHSSCPHDTQIHIHLYMGANFEQCACTMIHSHILTSELTVSTIQTRTPYIKENHKEPIGGTPYSHSLGHGDYHVKTINQMQCDLFFKWDILTQILLRLLSFNRKQHFGRIPYNPYGI